MSRGLKWRGHRQNPEAAMTGVVDVGLAHHPPVRETSPWAPSTSSRGARRPWSYSMATSSAEDVPRTLDFLFSRNRLNVAVSRAMCLACIVASPRLLESRARTIEQMRLINALCRFAEMAGEQATSVGR